MRFITRELYESIQTDKGQGPRDAWKKAAGEYRQRLELIEPQLPDSVRALLDSTLHDAVLVGVEQPCPGVLLLRFDGDKCIWPEGEIELEFHGVAVCEIPENVLGDQWLYEEWDRPRQGTFELSVLMERSELRVVGSSVTKRIGAFPIRLVGEHACDANAARQARVVRVMDVRSTEPAVWVSFPAADDDASDDVIVRNLPLARRIRACPFCGVALRAST